MEPVGLHIGNSLQRYQQGGESHSRKPRALGSYPVAGHKERPQDCSLTWPGSQGRAAIGRGEREGNDGGRIPEETPEVIGKKSRNLRLGK